MKLQHMLGGIENLGPVWLEPRPFVEQWETRIFGIHVAMMALSTHLSSALPGYDMASVPTTFKHEWTWGHLRTGAEAMNPFDYFKFRYYEKWLGGISSFFIEQGYITEAELTELTERYLKGSPPTRPQKDLPAVDAQIIKYLREGDSPARPAPQPPAFALGDRVVIKDVHPAAHTRLPGYLRGKQGVIDHVYDGSYAYFFSTGPDGIGAPMPVYVVKFTPEELWGSMSEPNNVIFADLFEAYLQPAEAAAESAARSAA
ncbi:MAG TPA: nitrile hydratase subunit beta [Polyangiaceae bacterium]|nr:nitrile hydratase subunit beta [Polyangiaceae bacterium]